ncbi:MAG: hypothetical protein ABSF81_16365, partial [Bacteroidales bacterium]
SAATPTNFTGVDTLVFTICYIYYINNLHPSNLQYPLNQTALLSWYTCHLFYTVSPSEKIPDWKFLSQE